MLPCLVSGNACISGLAEFQDVIATLNEMNEAESAFEDFRTELNEMGLQYPQHSIFPCVFSMVETIVGPIVKDKPHLEMEFAESIRLTVESVMPWSKFQDYAKEMR